MSRRWLRARRLAAFFLRCRNGIAAIEFALAAPVLLVMTAGVYEFGSAFQAQSAVNKLASQYAASWADCIDSVATPCSGELPQYLPNSNPSYVITNIAPQLNSTTAANALSIRMIWVTMSGTAPSLTATIKYGRECTFPTTCVTLNLGDPFKTGEQALAQAAFTQSGQQGVIATVKYSYLAFTLPNFLSIPVAGISMTNMVPQLTNN